MSVTLAYCHKPENLPGKTLVGLKVTCPPNSVTPPHYHGGSVVTATMIRGKTLNQMVCPDHDPQSQGTGPLIMGEGDSWYEPPGCHHVRSENPFEEQAEFVANFVADTERIEELGLVAALVVIDAEEEQKARAQV